MLKLPIILAALISADAGAATTLTVGKNELSSNRHYIHQSHMFHVEPHAIISSVLSDVRQRSLTERGEGIPFLDIDLSSNQLDDASAVFFTKELLALLKSKVIDESVDSQSEAKVPLSIKLVLAMNKLTPSGASSLFETLIGRKVESDPESATNSTLGISTNNQTSDNANNTNLDELEPVENSEDEAMPDFLIEELDLSFNDIGGHGVHPPNVQLLDSTRRLFEGGRTTSAPRILTLENCGIGPAFCRSIGRGFLNAFERKHDRSTNLSYRPSVLRIGGNSAIGDSGTVALAAALRMAMLNDGDNTKSGFDELDLSSCNVGDAGAEALALALSSNPGCLNRLDLSNNKISDAGSKALGRALVDALHSSGAVFEQIILDNNVGIGDDGAAALAEAMALGAVKSISIRSCSIQAEGIAAFGKAVLSLASRKQCDDLRHVHIDMSGNHFGTRKIKKKKGARYSASLIKDKASTNIKFIGKTLKGAAKRFSAETIGLTAESDDDEEVMGGLIDEEEDEDADGDKLKACGGMSFAGEIIRGDEYPLSQKKDLTRLLKISIGMRQCCLDDGALDALAASIAGAKNLDISVDASMNSGEENVVDALKSAEKDSKLLTMMAQRHMDLLDRIANARQRQLEAAEAAAARGAELGGAFFDEDDDFYDIGFDYDDDFD